MPAATMTLFSREIRSIHCVGIAGMGLGPLAIYLARLGLNVSGEDDSMVEPMRVQLERAGISLVASGTLPAGCELVAISSAVSSTHPILAQAAARNIPVVRRGELLAEVAKSKKLVAVCGSHGKTTTTAMLVTALRAANFQAGYVLGGLFASESIPPAAAGRNEWLVAEIDESDGTISRFSPTISVVVNFDWDHPDFYRRQEDLEETFAALLERTSQSVLINASCALSAKLVRNVRSDAVNTFGHDGDYRASTQAVGENGQTLALGGRFPQQTANVRAQGDFNALNATAALAAATLMGAPLLASMLADYPGVRRRQTVLHSAEGVAVIEDYAHHPSEIRALLQALRRRVSAGGRLVTVFQPHRFSRTAQFRKAFAESLALADEVHLMDVYPAGEARIEEGTTTELYAEMRGAGVVKSLYFHPGYSTGWLETLARNVKPGDLIAFVGAGDIDRAGRAFVEILNGPKQDRWDELAAALSAQLAPGTKVKREESLAEKTTMRVGGPARVYVEPASAEGLRCVLREARSRGIPVQVLGRGSNLLIPDDGVDAVVIAFHHPNWHGFEILPDGRVRVGAGLRLKNLCGLATKAGLVGFEFLEGIPGNVGGALRMNAGAMDGWMFDVVESVRLMTRDGEERVLARGEMHVDYRHCAELHEGIALEAWLRPSALSESDSIARQIDVYRDKRHKTQPREPSAGCIFKNPPGNSAGRLIDQSGLKGERIGDAEVSPVHANFIVNRGRATSADVIALVRRIRARVERAKGVKLEPEAILYGREWKDVL